MGTVGWTARWGRGAALVALTVTLTVTVTAMVPITTAAATTTRRPLSPVPHTQVNADVAALSKLPTSLAAGRPYLQGYDVPMRLALLDASTNRGFGDGATTKTSLHGGRAVVVRTGEARFPFAIVISGPKTKSSDDFTGVLLKDGGHWKISWTTMCLLVELGGEPCPTTPKGLDAGDILPAAGPPLAPTDLTPGLVDPADLAIAAQPNGGVLIADDARNEILQWRTGTLTVVAGDGLQGFSGDGGPAVDAELNDPGEMAIGPNGSIYFVDQGNHRIREVNIAGVITTVAGNGQTATGNTPEGDGLAATDVALDPVGIAASPTGSLWVSSDDAIRTVSTGGIIGTRIVGQPPYGDLTPRNGQPTAFSPGELALDGEGSLVAFSFDTKGLFVISPDNQVSLVSNYANALATAPNGSVLIAEHDTRTSTLTGTTTSTLMSFGRGVVPGLQFGLAPHGIAETSDGTVYVDSEPGDGWTDQTGLYAITGGVVRAVTLHSSLSSTLPPVGATGFPATQYPATGSSTGSDPALTACPSMQGVTPFTASARRLASTLLGFWGTSLSYDLHASDRAAWPLDVNAFTGGPFQGRQQVGTLTTTAKSLFAHSVAAACGRALVDESIAVTMVPTSSSSVVEHLFLLDRNGTPQVYFSAP
jgi:hypothetical protein